jgi:hypothetical protein
MKKSKFPFILSLAISLEMVLSPLPALAQNSNVPVSQTVLNGLNVGMSLMNAATGYQAGFGNMPPYVAKDMAELQKQQTPAPDKHFTLANMQKIPGLMEYIAVQNQKAASAGGKPINPAALNCQTLPTTLYEANNEVCRNRSVNSMSGNPAYQRDEAFAYYNQYLQIDKLYKNYSVSSNVGGQAYGTGCMEDAMNVLKGFFAYRLEQLNTVVTNMEAATAKFQEQSEMDLRSVRESSAILNGEDSVFAKDFKDSDTFNYSKRFGDPACSSILSKDAKEGVAQLGKERGLLGIEDKLKSEYTSVPNGSKYSLEQYNQKHAEVVQDIKNMADKVAQQATLNFSQLSTSQEGYSSFVGGLAGDISSESGANVALNKSFFSDLQSKFAKTRKTLSDEAELISSELGKEGEQALKYLNNVDKDSSFSSELVSLEKNIKSECLARSGISKAISRIYDPNLSQSANKQSSAVIQKRINSIISDSQLSPDRKLQDIKAIQKEYGDRFELKMDANYETQEVGANGEILRKTVNASQKVTPVSYISDVMKNCDTQFQVNKLNNKLSGKEAIQRLKSLKKDFQAAAEKNSKDMKNEIIKKMVECNGNGATAASAGVGSCSSEKLNMQNPNFCAKAAFSCSANMKQCSEKAQKFVKDIKQDRSNRINNYNNNVEATRKSLVGMFDTALVKYMKEAESLRAMFGTGFTSPTGIERDIKDGNQYSKEYQGDPGDNLAVKDPKAYLEMVKTNMNILQDEIKKQQEGIIGDNGILQQHIKQTKSNYNQNVLAKASSLARDCLAAYDSYAKMMGDQKTASDQSQGELGEKKAAFCGRYNDIMSSNPIPGCDDGYSDVTTALITAAEKAGDSNTSYEAQQLRRKMAEVCAKPGNQRGKDGASTTTASMVCTKARNNDQDAIDVLKIFNDDWKLVCEAISKSSGDVAKSKCKEIPGTTTTTTAGTVTSATTYDCSDLKDSIISDYEYKKNSSTVANVGVGESTGNDSSSFCNASNNSGFNTKGDNNSIFNNQATTPFSNMGTGF